MTYEELLAKIDAITGIKYNFETNVVTYGNPHGQHRFIVNQALRAVVELHKPVKLGNEVICGLCCYESGDVIDSYLLRQNYPCSTIQAIEKELK